MASPQQRSGLDHSRGSPARRSIGTGSTLTRQLEDLTARFTELERSQHSLSTAVIILQEDNRNMRSGNTELQQDIGKLREDYTKLQEDHKKLHGGYNKLQEDHEKLHGSHTKLQEDHEKLHGGHNKLQEDHEKLHGGHTKLQEDHEKLREAHTKLQQDQAKLREDHTKLQQDPENNDLQKRFAQLELYLKTFQTDHGKLLNDQEELKKKIDDMRSGQQAHPASDVVEKLQGPRAQSDIEEQMASMKADIDEVRHNQDQISQQQTDHVNSVRVEQESFQAGIESLQTDHFNNFLSEKEKFIENASTVQTFQDQLVQIRASLTEMENRLGKTGWMFAAVGIDRTRTRNDRAVVFHDVRINTDGGAHYNLERGMFTVPHTGLYFFSARLASCGPGVTVCAYVMFGKVRRSDIEGGAEGRTWSQLVHMEVGQEVWLRSTAHADQYADVDQGGSSLCFFRGMLVLPLEE